MQYPNIFPGAGGRVGVGRGAGKKRGEEGGGRLPVV